IRKCRVTSADARETCKDVAELVAFCDPLHLRSRVGYGDEATARFVWTDGLLHALEEVSFEDVRLERAARFALNNEQSFAKIHLLSESLDLRAIRRTEHMQLRIPINFAIGHPQHFGAKARTSHAEKQHILEAAGFRVLRQLAQVIVLRDLILCDSQPAEP